MTPIKYITIFLISTAFVLILAACDCIVGEGNIISEERDVSGFDRISLRTDAKVILRQDSAFYLRIEAQPNIMELLKTEVHGQTLEIKYDLNCVLDAMEVTLYLSMPEIHGVDVSGSGSVICMRRMKTDLLDLNISGSGEILMDLAAEQIKSTISGSGEIELTGTTKKHGVGISGSGGLYAYDLRSADSRVRISGSGEAKVFAVGTLEASISGSGSVYYKGNPELNTKINGSGQVKKVN